MAKQPITMKVEGEAQIQAALRFKGQAAAHNISKELMAAALILHGAIVISVQRGSRTGLEYPRPGGTTHVASAPGEPPKSDTGNLASNIIPDIRNTKEGTEVVVVSRAPYSAALEFGTKDGRIKARPFMRPAYEEKKKQILELVARALKKGTNA